MLGNKVTTHFKSVFNVSTIKLGTNDGFPFNIHAFNAHSLRVVQNSKNSNEYFKSCMRWNFILHSIFYVNSLMMTIKWNAFAILNGNQQIIYKSFKWKSNKQTFPHKYGMK